MKKRLQGLIAGVLIGATLTGGAIAATGTKAIDVLYNNIKVYKDNVLCELKDANGTIIEPFIYNGTTYMPVRGTANLAGMDVSWDDETQSVYLWDEISCDEIFLMDVCPPYSGVGMDFDNIKMAGTYYDGFSLGLTSADCYALINLNGSYSSLSMTIAPVDDEYFYANLAKINFYLDNHKIKTVDIHESDYPTEITIPLNYAKQLKIENQHINNGSPALIGFGNLILK